MHLPDRPSSRRLAAATALLAGLTIAPVLRPAPSAAATAVTHAKDGAGCTLANGVSHLIYIQFDNTHFMRDLGRDGSTNVPSDLEQMPHLLSFIEGNGTLLSNHHTPLISHTSDDLTTSQTGVYPSRHGVATSANSYYYYDQTGTPKKTSGFTYWTSKIGDGQYNFTSAPNTNAPAPWVPFTRAGCNVGGVSMTGFALENTGNDLATVFPNGAPPSKNPFADFLGVAVHCAAGNTLCASGNGGVPDVLPNEPNADGSPASAPGAGYQGFNALYGHKLIAGAISPDHTNLPDINGNPIVDDFNGSISPGFPGFSIAPQYSLGYTADLQENGVPVTFAYVITPHRPLPDNPYGYGFPSDTRDYGPGEAHYVQQLKQFDASFNAFFTQLASHGIDKSNTLFVFSSEEGDHFIGGPASPAGCNGVNMACTYNQLGELTTNLDGLLQGEQGANLPAAPGTADVVNNDDAPDIYLRGNPPPADRLTRAYEQATGALVVTNPIAAALNQPAEQRLTQFMANPVEYKILHMLTADPLRTPSYTAFANPDYYVEGAASVPPSLAGCGASATPSSACVVETPGFNWNHGDVQPEITTTWLGLVGPGVLNRGLDGANPTQEALGARFGTFSDHTDIRPTILQVLGLHDDYASDGRVLIEALANSALPSLLQSGHFGRFIYIRLAQLYKQLNAPLGAFDLASLQVSTLALESTSPSDVFYNGVEQQLAALGDQRDRVAGQILALLNAALSAPSQYQAQSLGLTTGMGQAQQVSRQGYALLAQSRLLAARTAEHSAGS